MVLQESRKRAVLEAAVLNFPNIAAGETEELTVESQEAYAGGIVTLGQPSGFPDGLIATAFINASDQIVVRVHNPTAADIDPSAGAAIAAEATLTMDTEPLDGDDYTIDAKVYTFQTTLTDVDGNVNIGASLAQAKLNLVSAMDLSGVAGTDYATSMSAHTTVDVAAFISDDAVLTAKVAGRAGNLIALAETFDEVTNVFDAAFLGTTTQGADADEADWNIGLIL